MYEDQENTLMNRRGEPTQHPNVRGPLMAINIVTISTTDSAIGVMSKDKFDKALESNVNISYTMSTHTNNISNISLLDTTPSGTTC